MLNGDDMSNIDKVLEFYGTALPKADGMHARTRRAFSGKYDIMNNPLHKIEVSIYVSDTPVNEASGATAEEAAGAMLAKLPIKSKTGKVGLWLLATPPDTGIKIQVIKAIRIITGLGLHETKDLVESRKPCAIPFAYPEDIDSARRDCEAIVAAGGVVELREV